jgi:hypothetical protein
MTAEAAEPNNQNKQRIVEKFERAIDEPRREDGAMIVEE